MSGQWRWILVALASLGRGLLLPHLAFGHDDEGFPARGVGGIFVRGEADGNGRLEITDAIAILGYLFLGSAEPNCLDALDADDSGRLELTDGVAVLSHLFLGGFDIPAPFPGAGGDPTADDLVCDNGLFGFLRREVFAAGCSSLSCHSSAAGKGGLVLDGPDVYSQLFQAPSLNEKARAAGLLRVRAGLPEESFLYRKLTGRLGPEEGERMPEVGAPLAAEIIALVRHWIEDGAAPSTPNDIRLSPPARGEQINVPAFPVPAGGETQRTYYFKLKNAEDILVNRIEFLYPPGSHHLNLFSSDAISKPNGYWEESYDAVPFQFWSMRASSQIGRLDWRLPPGVYTRFKPFQQVMAQIHFVNTGPQVSPIGGCAAINLHAADPAAVSVPLGNLFIQNKNVLLPPRSETSWDYGVTFTRFRHNDLVRAAAVTGHFHWRGKTFEIRRWDGLNKNDDGSPLSGEFERMGIENRIFFSGNWDEPPFVIFGDNGPEFPRGWGVVYRTTYVNPTDQTITFGPQVEINEHSNVFVYFYPGPASGETFSFPLPFQQ